MTGISSPVIDGPTEPGYCVMLEASAYSRDPSGLSEVIDVLHDILGCCIGTNRSLYPPSLSVSFELLCLSTKWGNVPECCNHFNI